MSEAFQVTADKHFRPQLHLIVLVMTWLVSLATFGLYVFFVYSSIWRPWSGWWLLTLAAILVFCVFAACLVAQRFWRRSQQAWAIAVFLFTVWPVVFFACFVWLVVQTANERGDMNLSLSVRTFGFWVSNYFEWEAGYRYPRITEGQHVQLYDSGKLPNVARMVEEMDQHIRLMARLLGKEPPSTKTGWVRGPVFGQTGRAVGAWALCSTKDEKGELTRLDRHEVAHTTITTLGKGTQCPPMLLAEGWSQSQSEDPDKLIQALRMDVKYGSALSLQQLVSETYYGRSVSAAYTYGGPLTIYLIDRFGGPKFFELYGGVQRATFLEDAQRILGVSWPDLEVDFWSWLGAWSPPEGERMALVFANPEMEKRWQQIAKGVHDFEKTHPVRLPENIAFSLPKRGRSYLPSLVIEDGRIWMTTEYPGRPDESKTYATNSKRWGDVYLEEGADGTLDGDVQLDPATSQLRQMANNAWVQARPGSLRNHLNFDLLTPVTFQQVEEEILVQSIETGQKPGDPWRVQLISRADGETEFGAVIDLKLDSANGFRVVESRTEFDDGESYEIKHKLGKVNGYPVVLSSNVVGFSKAGEETFRYTDLVEPLSQDEADSIKLQVDEVVKRSRKQLPSNWNRWIFNPYSVGFGWLMIAGLVLAIDWLGNRLKFPALDTAADKTH